MRVALSGSTGFIGSALRAALAADGHEVVPIVLREPAPGEIGLDIGARSVDCSQIGGHIGAVDVVYHLAGRPLAPRRWSAAVRENIRASRIGSTDAIARAIAAAPTPPGAFVTMSASGYYGDRDDEVLSETSGGGSGFLADLCRAWEAAAAPARAVGVRVAHARTGIVLGRGGLLARLVPVFRLGLGGRLGPGTQWMSPIALEDEVRALTFLGTEEIAGAANLCAPEPVTNEEFSRALAAALHRPALVPIPAVALEIAIGRRNARELALASQRMVPERLLEAGFRFRLPDLGDALRAAL